ncbi:hypothetical protein SAMN04488058_101296 [Deinococcus reticulitermitis]|uniref:Uncharacterized protein n=1 Tax=Deinococcus reticulitermitis TaxID=856736 RepID=A0A1H6SQC1_9DEIO|nr:hypothetical protein [Deinococcus reticulitermitis]SEI66997.1 hypothetical protein SAMN04488058_101296 [Deinococcus reticulitermitis]
MRAIVLDLRDRLSVLGVPVLLPEDRDVPHQAGPTDAQGRPMVGGGERGLGAYLRQHPQGFVQLEEPQGITVSGAVQTYWVALGCVAPTPETAEALAREVLRLTCGLATREPGHYTLVIPDSPRALADGAYLTRPTVSRAAIGGQL